MGLHIESAEDIKRGLMVGITGLAGAGKTTMASTFPRPLILDLEGGAFVLKGRKVRVHRQWEHPRQGRQAELMGVLRELAKEEGIETIVIDSWTELSEWIEQDILEEHRGQSLSTVADGFGAGQGMHKKRTLKVIEALQWFQEARGVHVVWIMHSLVRDETRPSGEKFSFYTHEGNKSSVAQVMRACDLVGQLQQTISVVGQTSRKSGQVKGKGDRELITGTVPFAAVKSRFHDGKAVIPVTKDECPLADIL